MATPERIGICQMTLILTILAFLVLGTTCIILFYVLYNRRLRLKELEVISTVDIDDKVMAVLDIVINDCFKDYQILRLIPMQKMYITEEHEDRIRKDMVDMVTTRISPYTLEKLSLVYNPAHIAEVISDKIYIVVMNYVLNVNLPYNDEELSANESSSAPTQIPIQGQSQVQAI